MNALQDRRAQDARAGAPMDGFTAFLESVHSNRLRGLTARAAA
jgi:hypothetical protein